MRKDNNMIIQLQRYYALWKECTAMYEEWSKDQGLSSNGVFALHSFYESNGRCTQKIAMTVPAISQYAIPERILLGIPLLNCPKESAPVTNSRNKLPIPFPNAPKKTIQSLRKTGERIAVNSVVVMLYHASRNKILS